MDPNEIRRLLSTAETLSREKSSTPEAFLVAFVAWEGLKFRILLVGYAARGVKVSEARHLIRDADIWNIRNYNTLFELLFGSRPQNAPQVGRLFNALDGAMRLRNRFVHGAGRAAPVQFRTAYENICRATNADWESALSKLLAKQGLRPKVTNPLNRIRVTAKKPGTRI